MEGAGKRTAALTVVTVALTLAVRVLGISLVLPVFAPYGLTLTDNLFLVGLAFGAYGLSMALLQIPLGAWSDRVGRKPVLLGGLLVGVIGSVAAAYAPSIWLLVAARLLQGAGAVNGAAMALVGDVVSERRRTLAMAVVGAGIGGGFVLGLVLGPALAPAVGGVPGLFLVNAALTGVVGLVAVAVLPRVPPAEEAAGRGALGALREPTVLRLSGAGFSLNFAQNAVLFALPLAAVGVFDATWFDGYHRALATMALLGGLVMFATARASDKGFLRPVLLAGFVLLAVTPLALLHVPTPAWMLATGVAFFAAHSTLAASLPSLASRLAGREARGATLGAFNLSQYAGAFAGGALGGLLWGRGVALAAAVAVLALAALALLHRLPLPRRNPRPVEAAVRAR